MHTISTIQYLAFIHSHTPPTFALTDTINLYTRTQKLFLSQTYHIYARFWTLVDRYLKTCISITARIRTPCTVILGMSSDTQRTIGMFSVRTKYITFVQCNTDSVHVMISIPNHAHACFIFPSVRFVRVLKQCTYENHVILLIQLSLVKDKFVYQTSADQNFCIIYTTV